MPRTRKSYVQEQTLQQFPYFVKEKIEKSTEHIKITPKDFSVITIIKLLNAAVIDAKTFSDLYFFSGVRMKRSFLNYLNLCTNFGFLERDQRGFKVYYMTTKTGHEFLNMFRGSKC